MKRGFPLLILAFLTCTQIAAHADFPSTAPFSLTSGTTAGGAAWASAPSGINVTFPSGATSKITWSAGGTPWNWSAAAQMAVVVSNTGTNPAPLVCLVTDSMGKQVKAGVLSTSDQCTWIPAGSSQTILIDLTKGTANDSLTGYGMANSPPVLTGSDVWMADVGNVGSSAPNYSSISSCSMQMLNQSGSPITLNIQSVLLYEPSPISALYSGIVDEFGQFSRGTWVNKITGVADFAARLSTENADLSSHPGLADRDDYGGWTAVTTGSADYFRTQNIDGKWWLVAPGGDLFFSTGMNHIFPSSPGPLSYQHASDGNSGDTYITQTRESMFQSIPSDLHAYTITIASPRFPSGAYNTYDFYGANIDHKYGTTYGTGACFQPWVDHTIARLKSWGFNTVANFSDVAAFQPTQQIAYVVYFHTAAASLINGIPDPYDPTFVTQTDAQASTYMRSEYVNDRWCLGYICDNERSWGGSPIASDYLTNTSRRYIVAIKALAADDAGGAHPAKGAFQQQMIGKYGSIAALNAAWGTGFASWTAFLSPYTVPGSPNAAMIADMGSFTTDFAKTYATSVNGIIKARDPHHLYLGCRLNSCSPEVLQGLVQGQDVISFNVYAPSLDASAFAFTSTLGKPCMITEYSFGSVGDNGMFGYGYTTQRAAGQADRANRFMAYVQSVAALPAFVGVHWFEYVDQPLTGRTLPDGEDYNFGFVDVADTPYQPMVDAARLINGQIYNIHEGEMAIPALMEAEETPVYDYYTVAGGGWQDISDSTLSNGAGTQLNASANNDYITFATPSNVSPGTYNVRVGIKTGPALGKFRLYVGDTGYVNMHAIGSLPPDEYSASPSTGITEVDLGNWTTSTDTVKLFKALIVNKNSHSSGNTIVIDYIKLQ